MATNFVTEKNIIVKIWASLNKKANKKVTTVITLTNGMANILEKYADRNKIHVVPAWGNLGNLKIKDQKENLFNKKYNLQDKFIVMYSGNLGKEYHLQALVLTASQLKNYTDILIIIMGEGWHKASLQSIVTAQKLTNCLLLPFQANEVFTDSLQSFQVGVVALAGNVNDIAIPSKTYNLLAAQKPILCIGGLNTELAHFLNEHNVGKAIEPDNIEEMKDYILQLYTDEIYFNAICGNSKNILSDYTRENANKIVALSML